RIRRIWLPLADKLAYLTLQFIEPYDIIRVFQHVNDKFVVESQAVEEIFLRQNAEFDVFPFLDFRVQKIAQVFLTHIADDQQVQRLVLFLDEAPGKNHQGNFTQALHFFHEFFFWVGGLVDDRAQFVDDQKVFIDIIVLFSVLGAGFQQSDLLQIIQFSSDGINLLIEFSSQLYYKKYLIGGREESSEKFYSGVRTKQFLEHIYNR